MRQPAIIWTQPLLCRLLWQLINLVCLLFIYKLVLVVCVYAYISYNLSIFPYSNGIAFLYNLYFSQGISNVTSFISVSSSLNPLFCSQTVQVKFCQFCCSENQLWALLFVLYGFCVLCFINFQSSLYRSHPCEGFSLSLLFSFQYLRRNIRLLL